MRTSPPCARTPSRSVPDPGTRSMSPNEVRITSGRRAMAIALSISSSGVTHTGQPGPCTSVISGGSIRSIPDLISVCVCPPQISMIIHGRVTVRSMAASSLRASASFRYSSTNRMGFPLTNDE